MQYIPLHHRSHTKRRRAYVAAWERQTKPSCRNAKLTCIHSLSLRIIIHLLQSHQLLTGCRDLPCECSLSRASDSLESSSCLLSDLLDSGSYMYGRSPSDSGSVIILTLVMDLIYACVNVRYSFQNAARPY